MPISASLWLSHWEFVSRFCPLVSSLPMEMISAFMGQSFYGAVHAASNFFRSLSIRSNTPAQPPASVYRKRRRVGYQGLSSRSSIQRQSATAGSTTQTGTPMAPAQWATAVSAVTIRSRLIIAAAVSAKVSSRLARSAMGKPAVASSSLPVPFCRLKSRTSGCSRANGESRQGHHAEAVILVGAATVPGDADLETAHAGQFASPMLGLVPSVAVDMDPQVSRSYGGHVKARPAQLSADEEAAYAAFLAAHRRQASLVHRLLTSFTGIFFRLDNSWMVFPHRVLSLGAARTEGPWRLRWNQSFGPFVYETAAPVATLRLVAFGPCSLGYGPTLFLESLRSSITTAPESWTCSLRTPPWLLSRWANSPRRLNSSECIAIRVRGPSNYTAVTDPRLA